MSDILVIDLIKALWGDAAKERDPAERARKERDAQLFQDVWERSPYALAPTRDQMTAALGNASLNLAESLDTVVREQKRFQDDWNARGVRLDSYLDTAPVEIRSIKHSIEHAHEAISNQNVLIAVQNERLGELTAATEANGTRLGKLEADAAALKQGQAVFTNRLEELDQRHNDQVRELDTRHAQQWEEVAATVEHIKQRLEADEEHFEGRLNKKRSEIDALKAENAELREELTAINEYMANNKRGEFDAMKERLEALEQRLAERADGDR